MTWFEKGTDNREDDNRKYGDDDAVEALMLAVARIMMLGWGWGNIPRPCLHHTYDGLHDCGGCWGGSSVEFCELRRCDWGVEGMVGLGWGSVRESFVCLSSIAMMYRKIEKVDMSLTALVDAALITAASPFTITNTQILLLFLRCKSRSYKSHQWLTYEYQLTRIY